MFCLRNKKKRWLCFSVVEHSTTKKTLHFYERRPHKQKLTTKIQFFFGGVFFETMWENVLLRCTRTTSSRAAGAMNVRRNGTQNRTTEIPFDRVRGSGSIALQMTGVFVAFFF